MIETMILFLYVIWLNKSAVKFIIFYTCDIASLYYIYTQKMDKIIITGSSIEGSVTIIDLT